MKFILIIQRYIKNIYLATNFYVEISVKKKISKTRKLSLDPIIGEKTVENQIPLSFFFLF